MGFMTKTKIKVVRIDGVITASGGSGILNKNEGSAAIIRTLHDIKTDSKIKGVLLRINSPGGTAGASQEIAALVEDIRNAGKPVVASIADMACSGAYMIASVCDYIFANRLSIAGSIGVIMQIPNYQGLSEKIGVTYNTIKSGDMKDIGNPVRPMTEEERAYLTAIAVESHQEFISIVQKHRSIKSIEEMTDGRFISALQAKENGLIDDFGTFYDALEYLCEKIGVTEKDIKLIDDSKKKNFISKILSLKSLVGEVTQAAAELRL